MAYLISFLEGIITFVSPCLLPMLPIYISYFAGGNISEKRHSPLKNALGFVLGFTIVFVVLGAFAGSVGHLLKDYQIIINIMTGGVVIVFGLNFLGVFNINLFSGFVKSQNESRELNFVSSVLFGLVFSIGWTPCVGAFLGSALMLASQQGSSLKGVVMLLLYSAGLGIPFIVSAVLIDKLKAAFDFIKRNYRVINIVSGLFLIVIGILMVSGYMGYFLSLLTF